MQASDYSDVFVSYRRKDVEFTKQLVDALQDAGKEVWIDWEDIPPGSEGFSDDIRRGLEGADAFIAILSPDYLESTYCVDLELGNAVKMNKKLIPIVLKKFDDYEIPQGIGHINWIYFTPHAGQENNFEESFQKVLDTLEIDLDYNREHKRYLLRALEWDSGGRSGSFLLTGDEIDTAEAWLIEGASKAPSPTELHSEYIQASRNQAVRRQRMLVTGVSVALVVSLILTVLSLIGFQQASVNAEIARANEAEAEAAEATAVAAKEEAETQEALAVTAREEAERSAEVSTSLALASAALQPDNSDIAVTLAMYATQIENPPNEAISALMKTAYSAGMLDFVQLNGSPLTFQTDVTTDGKTIIIGAHLYELATGEPIQTFDQLPDVSISAQFLPGDEQVIIAGDMTGMMMPPPIAVVGETSPDVTPVPMPEINTLTMGVYSVADGTLIRELSQETVEYLQLSTDGTQVAASHIVTSETAIYDIASGEEIARLPHRLNEMALSANFEIYAHITRNDDEEQSIIRIVDVTSQDVHRDILLEDDANLFYVLAFNPANQTLLVKGNNTFSTYDVETGDVVTSFDHFAGAFTQSGEKSIGFTPDGQHLIIGFFGEGRVNVWDTTTGDLRHSFKGHHGTFVHANIVDNTTVVSLDNTGRIITWDLTEQFVAGTLTGTNLYVDRTDNAVLLQDNNGEFTRISLETFEATEPAFVIPDDVQIITFDDINDMWFAVSGQTVQDEYGQDVFDATTLLVVSAHTGDVIAEMSISTTIDDLPDFELLDGVTAQPVDRETVGELEIMTRRVVDAVFLNDTPDIRLTINYQIYDMDQTVWGQAYETFIWDAESNSVEPFSTTLDDTVNINHILRATDGRLYVGVSEPDNNAEEFLLQLDPYTREEISRRPIEQTAGLRLLEETSQLLTITSDDTQQSSTLFITDLESGEEVATYDVSVACCDFLPYDPISKRVANFASIGQAVPSIISASLEFRSVDFGATAVLIDAESNTVLHDYDVATMFQAFGANYSTFITYNYPETYTVYRNDSLASLVEWTCANRYVADLNDDLRQAYDISSDSNMCDSITTSQ